MRDKTVGDQLGQLVLSELWPVSGAGLVLIKLIDRGRVFQVWSLADDSPLAGGVPVLFTG